MATNDKKTTSFLRRTAGEVKRYRKVRKVVPAVMGNDAGIIGAAMLRRNEE